MGNVEYFPPPDKSVDAFARDSCQVLSEHLDGDFSKHEVVRGWASYIKVLADLLAKKLNQQQSEAEVRLSS